MKKFSVIVFCLIATVAFAMWACDAEARSPWFTGQGECINCHTDDDDGNYCASCHAHGVHSDTAQNDINVLASTDKATYSPGEMVTVSITGGYRPGWVRAILYDENGVEVARSQGPGCGNPALPDNGCGRGETFPGPILLMAPAPTAPGTYMWNASWYGNEYDLANVGGTTTFGPGWVRDTSNCFTNAANQEVCHGEEIVMTNGFDVVADNQPPVAVDDAYTTDEDTTLTVASPGVLGNDNDPDGDTITAVLDTPTSNGSLMLNADGSFMYTPNANFFGTDSFTYFADDGQVNSLTPATVTITVNDINDPPVADANGPYTGTAGVPVSFDGSGSSDVDGTIVAYNWDFGDGNTGTGVAPTHTYAAAGTFTVTLTVTDDDGATGTDTATATIGDANLPPVAADDAYSTDEDVALNVPAPGVLANDSDPDGDAITAVLDTPTINGTLMLNADGSFMYTPNLNFFGTDSFTYFANDGQVNSLTPATVTITVNDVNDPPVADANGPYTGTAGIPVSFDGSGSSDVDGTLVAYDWDFGDGNTGTGVAPTHTYAAAGTFIVTLTVTDDDGATGTDTATAAIGDGNEPPLATDDAYSTDEDVTLNVPAPGVLANDNDPDGDPITAVLNTPTSNGSLTLNADGSFTYTPNLNFFGTDSFTYFANDGQVNSLTPATVTITVNDVNDPPVADANGPYTGTAGIPVQFDGSGSSDVDGTIVTYMWDFGDGGTGTAITPIHTYAAAGIYTVTLTVTDDDGATDTDTATATIGDANLPPVAADDAYSTDEDVTLNVPAPGVLANDNDPDGDPITAVLNTPTSNGSLMLNADGSFMYTPNLNFFGTDSFTYFANDGQVNSLTPATVTITVNDINDPPVADANGPYTGTAGIPVQFDGSGSSDVDGTIVTYMWDFGDGNTGMGVAPTHTYAMAGTYTVMLTVTDDDGATAMDTTTADIQDQVLADVSLEKLRAPKSLKIKPNDTVSKRITAVDEADTMAQSATVTISWEMMPMGLVNITVTPPSITEIVTPGNGGERFNFTADVSCNAPGTSGMIMWTAMIDAPQNRDSTNDVVTANTNVICR